MDTVFSIARSGMAAADLSLSASAHNIANQATPAFRRQEVQPSARPQGGVDASVTRAAEPGSDLAADIVGQKLALYTFKANARVLETRDEMLGTLLDTRA